ncbi:hypothetical protein ACI65C_011179 [Semiaphis heraclei]
MKTDIGKSFVVCLCVLIASSTCFQGHTRAETTKVKKSLGNALGGRIGSTSLPWESIGNKVGRSRIIFQLQDWDNSIVQKEQAVTNSRRQALPVLTLPKRS